MTSPIVRDVTEKKGFNPTVKTRIEKDLLGEKAVPADAYYGVQTARALENFQISGVELRLYPNFIKAYAMVKLAAARANHDVGGRSKEVLTEIEGAGKELIDGKRVDIVFETSPDISRLNRAGDN